MTLHVLDPKPEPLDEPIDFVPPVIAAAFVVALAALLMWGPL
jgi:hypothetical protein